MLVNILVLGKEAKQNELYAKCCRELVDCHIDIMSNTENAMSWLGRVQYHVVVLDLPQPLFTLERIKRIHPESAVVVLSGTAHIEDAVRAIRMGAEDFLTKPISMEAFKLAVQRGIDRKVLFEEDGIYSKSLNLVNSCQMISASLEEQRILSITKSYLTRELQCVHAGIFTLNKYAHFEIEDPDSSLDQGLEEIFNIALTNYKPYELFPDRETFYKFVERSTSTPAMFFYRFQCVEDRDYYYVALSPKKPEPLTEFEGRLKILRAQIDVTSHNIVRYRDVQKMAFIDDLTGLHNTRYLNTVLEREIEKARMQNTSFAILFIDADRFKRVNDEHGHLHGSR
ncbi:MAG: diguanylate cyclase, partial [Proteobacteria bacterium]